MKTYLRSYASINAQKPTQVGFIMSGVFTEVINVAVESGVPKEWAVNLILFSAGPEVRAISS